MAAIRHAADAWLDRLLDAFCARQPVGATFLGRHERDHALPDPTPAGAAAWLASLAELRAGLADLIRHEPDLTPAQRRDLRLAAGQLALWEWEATAPHFDRRNPTFATGEGVFSILALFLRDSEPLADRVAAAISRMRALPAFLAAAREGVSEAPAAWIGRARREADAALAYFADGLAILARERGIADPAFLPAAAIARDAFATHAAWLARLTALPDDAPGPYAAGRAAFDRYLHQGHCLPPEQGATRVRDQGLAAMARARADLAEQARALDPSRTPAELLAGLADHHPTAADYYAAFGRIWAAARAAAIAADLITWPEFPIAYVPIPPSDRVAAEGLYYLPYRCPAPFGRPEVHRYLVPPIEPDLDPAEQARRLRATNDYVIKTNHVVHHGGLGHHVQNWHAFRGESRLGRWAGVDCAARIALFGAGTLVEGWACYATDLMAEIGFLTPLERLAHTQGQIRMAARAVVDAGLHTGELTLAEAAAFYRREVGMPAAAALAEATKNSLFPGAAMIYLIGTQAIHALRARLGAGAGGPALRAFHDRFLRSGAIPVALIAADWPAEARA